MKLAEEILYAKNLRGAVSIHSEITNSGTYDPGRGYSGLNAWQPLGVAVGIGEEVTTYVGCDDTHNQPTGADTEISVVLSQYHAESGKVSLDTRNLKVG